jgi:predicted negative regulator of RcsB-dependent stress response
LHLRFIASAATLGHSAEALDDLTATLKRWPETLPRISIELIFEVMRGAHKLSHDAAIPLLQGLYALHWTDKAGNEPGQWWSDLSMFYLKHGNAQEAIEVSNRIDIPYDIMRIRVDRRYRALLLANPNRFDFDAAATSWPRKVRSLSETHPQILRYKVALLEVLMDFGHHSAALAAADSTVAEIESTNSPEKLYEDFKDQENWLLDIRAQALVHLGRYDEAVEQLTRASALFEDGQSNVSQNINLAQLYCDLGRPREALKTLHDMLGTTSPDGTMEIERVRVDAAAQLSDAKEQARALAYLRAHRRDAPATYLSALLSLNDLDGAAAWQMEQLRDPALRGGALMESQHYPPEPGTPRALERHDRLEAVTARPYMQAAIHAVGRQETFQIAPED